MTQKDNPNDSRDAEINSAVELAYAADFGVLDPGFLSLSISSLPLSEPLCVSAGETIDSVMQKLKKNKSGCALILNESEQLIGIFSERDYVLRIHGEDIDPHSTQISEHMTENPVTQSPDASMAHVLNLMSNGGFRHIPIVTDDNTPVWIVSVKDIVDYIVDGVSNSLLDFETLPDA